MQSVTRYAFFVDGSNLFGSMKHLNLEVESYEPFYKHILQRAVEAWRHSLLPNTAPAIQLRRVYWYEVGAIDDWDLDSPKTTSFIEAQFNAPTSKLVKAAYLAQVGRTSKEKDQTKLAKLAWSELLTDIRSWYTSNVTFSRA